MGQRDEAHSGSRWSCRTVGKVSDVVQQGGGKLTLTGGDQGEPLRKPKGQE